MSESEKTNHWARLADDLGAKLPDDDIAASQYSPETKRTEAAQPEPSQREARPPVNTERPKRKPAATADWSQLASTLGISPPPSLPSSAAPAASSAVADAAIPSPDVPAAVRPAARAPIAPRSQFTPSEAITPLPLSPADFPAQIPAEINTGEFLDELPLPDATMAFDAIDIGGPSTSQRTRESAPIQRDHRSHERGRSSRDRAGREHAGRSIEDRQFVDIDDYERHAGELFDDDLTEVMREEGEIGDSDRRQPSTSEEGTPSDTQRPRRRRRRGRRRSGRGRDTAGSTPQDAEEDQRDQRSNDIVDSESGDELTDRDRDDRDDVAGGSVDRDADGNDDQNSEFPQDAPAAPRDAEDKDRPRRRRRRRSGRGGDRSAIRAEGGASAGERSERPASQSANKQRPDRSGERVDDLDEVFFDDDDGIVDLDLDEVDLRSNADASRGEDAHPRDLAGDDVEDHDIEDHDDGDDDDSDATAKISHRNIPNWPEAIGFVVAANMESRTRSPQGGGSSRDHGRGRGGRGGGRSGGGRGGSRGGRGHRDR